MYKRQMEQKLEGTGKGKSAETSFGSAKNSEVKAPWAKKRADLEDQCSLLGLGCTVLGNSFGRE